MDLHKSHLFNYDFMKMMKDNNVEVCGFPAHCIHLLQPLHDIPFAAVQDRMAKGTDDTKSTIVWPQDEQATILQMFYTSLSGRIDSRGHKERIPELWHLPI